MQIFRRDRTSISPDVIRLGWVVLGICIAWMFVLHFLHREYLNISYGKHVAANDH